MVCGALRGKAIDVECDVSSGCTIPGMDSVDSVGRDSATEVTFEDSDVKCEPPGKSDVTIVLSVTSVINILLSLAIETLALIE